MEHLDENRPIQVGVNYKFGSVEKNCGNANLTTDHFIVITAMKFDKEMNLYYFEFYDPGTSHTDIGTSENNRLYLYEKDNGYILKGQRSSGTKYEVTEIRPNGDFSNKEGTTDLNTKKKEPCETIVCY